MQWVSEGEVLSLRTRPHVKNSLQSLSYFSFSVVISPLQLQEDIVMNHHHSSFQTKITQSYVTFLNMPLLTGSPLVLPKAKPYGSFK